MRNLQKTMHTCFLKLYMYVFHCDSNTFATLDFGDSVDGLKECLGTSKLQNDHKYMIIQITGI